MSTLKVNTITTVDGTGNITVSRPLSGSGASLTNLPAANLTGALPAISGAALTNLPGGAVDEITTQTSDPTASSPATPTLGDVILNTTTGEMFSCTTVSSGANVWVSVGSVAANLTGALPAISGASLTALNATQLTSGTLPDARLPATLPAKSGVNLTALNATQLTSGTLPDARLPATLPAKSGVNLTALNATQLTSGTLPDARFGTLPAVSGVNLTALNATQLTSGTLPDARFGTLPAVSGVNLTALNATNLGSGTLPDARFPATLPATSGANLTALPAGNLTGTVADARISALTASKLTGALPAISGASLTNLPAPTNNSVGLAQLAAGTDGNIITYDASGDPAHVATGTAGHVLTSGGAGVAPTFAANSHIPSDNSVGLAQLAAGTDGNLITYDASGDPAHVATGTAGHVLTSAGAGAPPTFAVNTHTPADNSVTGAKIAMGSDAAGDVLTYNGTDYIRLAKGTAAQVFTMNAGATAPEWAAAAGGGIAVPGSSVAGDTLYHNGTIYTRLAKGTAAQVLTMNSGATAPEWAAAGGGGAVTTAHAPVKAASTGNLNANYADNGVNATGVGHTLTNDDEVAAFELDGETLEVGDRVLIKDQTTASANGVYTVTTVGDESTNWVLTRATDADTFAEIGFGNIFMVSVGSVNDETAWYMREGTFGIGGSNFGGGQIRFGQIVNTRRGNEAQGDTLYHDGTVYTRLAKGTAAQVLTMNAGATAPEWAAAGGGGGPTVVSATLTNGASSYTFSSLPSGITRMQLWFYEVSLSGTDELLVQFGDSGGIETSNYTTASGRIMVYNGTSSAISNNGGFIIRLFEAAGDWSGVYNFWKMAAYWVGAHSGYQASTSSATTGGGNKAGLGTLTQIKIRPSGSNTFTVAGSFVSKIDLLYWQD